MFGRDGYPVVDRCWLDDCDDLDAVPEEIDPDEEPTVRLPPESMAALMGRIDSRGVPTPEELDAELQQHGGAFGGWV